MSSSAGMWQAIRCPSARCCSGGGVSSQIGAHAARAARGEGAAPLHLGGARERPLQEDARALVVRVRHRHGGQERLGVGVVGRREHGLDRAELDDLPQVHHRDVVGEIAHHGEVVGDEHERGFAAGLELAQEVDDRRLHRDVERGDGLVGDHHVRVAGERPGDGDALLLATRQLVGLPPGQLRRQPHDLEEVGELPAGGLAREVAEPPEGAADRVAHGVTRVERAVGVLEDHLELSAERPRAPVDRDGADLRVPQVDPAPGGGLEPAQHPGEGRLPRARLADDGERPGLRRLEIDLVERPHGPSADPEPAPPAGGRPSGAGRRPPWPAGRPRRRGRPATASRRTHGGELARADAPDAVLRVPGHVGQGDGGGQAAAGIGVHAPAGEPAADRTLAR